MKIENDTKIDLLIIGHTVIDHINFRNIDEILPGGSGPAVAMNATKNGINVGLLTRVGKDFPKLWLDELKKCADNSGIHIIDGENTRIDMIYSENGNIANTNISFSISNRFRDISFPSHYKASFVHICPMPICDQLGLIKKCPNNSMISIDFNQIYESEYKENPSVVKEIINNADIIFPNEFELQAITGINDIERSAKILHEIGPSFIIIKLGSKGAALYDGDKFRLYPPQYVSNIVDPTGCGDAFIGGFLSTYIKTNDIDLSMRTGNIMSAKKITKKGAWMI
jgi:sugar/nucleoside kinase (ribokinase family)